MLSVRVFEGNECVTEDHEVTMFEWSREELIRVISEFVGPCVDGNNDPIAWEDDVTTECFDPAEDGKKLGDTLEILDNNFAQAVKCAVNGGMVYVTRVC